MSGLETVKIIVDAEKEAARMLNEAQAKASEIRGQADAIIATERETRLSATKKEAAAVVQRAEAEGKSEAARFREESKERIKRDLQKASGTRAVAVKALFEILMG